VSDRLFELFDEYAAAYARGERPNAEDVLDRAGPEREQLAAMLAEYLQDAPLPAPNEDERRSFEVLVAEEPPLLILRRERKLRRDQVVEQLRERLELPLELEEKLGLRYHELETGQLEPARVDRRVWEALSEALQAKVEELMAWARPAGLAGPDMAYFRATAAGVSVKSAALSATSEPDEVDRLFGLA
jgi:hypothetical protein